MKGKHTGIGGNVSAARRSPLPRLSSNIPTIVIYQQYKYRRCVIISLLVMRIVVVALMMIRFYWWKLRLVSLWSVLNRRKGLTISRRCCLFGCCCRCNPQRQQIHYSSSGDFSLLRKKRWWLTRGIRWVQDYRQADTLVMNNQIRTAL